MGSLVRLWSLLLMVVSGVTHAATPPPAVILLHIVAARPISIGASGRILSLAPDGTRLLVQQGRQVCLYRTVPLARARCVPFPWPVLAPSVAWAPDSQRVAFTEDWFQAALASHIWVLDAVTGALRDLTANGVLGSYVTLTGPRRARAWVDAAPTWAPDGTALVFARTPLDTLRTALYRIAVKGGPPRRLLTLAGAHGFAIEYGMAWVGSTLLYTVADADPHTSANGLWRVEQDGRAPRRLLPAHSASGPPFLVGVTPDGGTALVYYALRAAAYTLPPGTALCALVDVRGGQVHSLTPLHSRVIGPTGAVFSPDGRRVLYPYHNPGSPAMHLMVRDLATGMEHELRVPGQQAIPLLGFVDGASGLSWARNGLIYIGATPYHGVLLTVAG